MNQLSNALIVAEQLADRHGDIYWFKNDYTLLRQNNGIMESIRQALVNQELWRDFVGVCDPVWLSKYYP